MHDKTSIVVSRSDDRVIVMIPTEDHATRHHAVIGEEEAFFASSSIRRMAAARERRQVVIGEPASGMVIERVDHTRLPLEIHLADDEGTTIVDLSRDDALGLADMLWGAHRSTTTFFAQSTVSGGVRRQENGRREGWDAPVPDLGAAVDARAVGDVERRLRGIVPRDKD